MAFPIFLPTTLRILNPADLFCNTQYTTVCITATCLRVAKRTPGTCPGGVPQRVRATSPSVDPRGVFPGDVRVTESPRQPVAWPPEAGELGSLTRRPIGCWKTWAGGGYARATPPPPGTGMSVRDGLWGGELLGLQRNSPTGCKTLP